MKSRMFMLLFRIVSRVYYWIPSPLTHRLWSVYSALTILNDRSFESSEYANLAFLEEGMKDRRDSIDNNQHENSAGELYRAYRKAKEIQRNVSTVYQPGGEWEHHIRTNRMEYLEALNSGDTSKLSGLLRNFFRNSGAHGISDDYSGIAEADVVTKKRFILAILKSYETWKDFVGGELKDLCRPFIGNPWGYYIHGNLIMGTSFRHHHYATLVSNLLVDIDNPVVAEIGGGFGGFAYYLLKDRDDLTYINFDLPEILLISSYYLLNAFPHKRLLLCDGPQLERMSLDTIKSYDIILLPNFELPKLETDSADLFFNTSSLSEMDSVTVEEYILQIARTCTRYFFHENSDRKVAKDGGHIEVPSSEFPVPANFKRIYKYPSLLTTERYREYLYERTYKVL